MGSLCQGHYGSFQRKFETDRRQSTSLAVATGAHSILPFAFAARHQQSPPANHFPSLRTPFGFLHALDWLAVVIFV